MGLDNRSGDPLVAAVLELCGKGLRRLDMRGLFDLTRSDPVTSVVRVRGDRAEHARNAAEVSRRGAVIVYVDLAKARAACSRREVVEVV